MKVYVVLVEDDERPRSYIIEAVYARKEDAEDDYSGDLERFEACIEEWEVKRLEDQKWQKRNLQKR